LNIAKKNDCFPDLFSRIQATNPAKYTQFADSLQSPPPAQALPLIPPVPASRATTPKAQILVIEDDLTWQAILQEYLTEAGHQVHLAATFDEAHQQLRLNRFQLVTLDARLQSGLQTQEGLLLLNYIRHQLKATLPIIIISGEIDRRNLIRAFRDFAVSNVLLKEDFDYNQFIQAVNTALAP
jgi:DNA-binding NtrC family response regulator